MRKQYPVGIGGFYCFDPDNATSSACYRVVDAPNPDLTVHKHIARIRAIGKAERDHILDVDVLYGIESRG